MRLIFATLLLAASLSLAACGGKNDDALSDDQVAEAASTKSASRPDRRCTAGSSHEAVKRELFRRAAEIRGSNASNYARIAEFAILQIEGAAPASAVAASEAVECRGRATLRLPGNLAVAGGRTALTGRIGYSVGNAAEGAQPVVTLTDDEAITIPLATLSQKRAPVPEPEPAEDPIAPLPEPETPPQPQPDPATAVVVRPSFDCRSARTRGELVVCASPALASLDQAMAAQYRVALSRADPPQARLLRDTRDSFLGYRDRCPTDACIATTYRGRMREIDDIMANRWRGQR